MSDHCPECGHKLADDALLSWGGYTLDEVGQELSLTTDRSVRARFTRGQTQVVSSLMRNGGRVVRKESILKFVYGLLPGCDEPEIKIIDVYMARIRKSAPWFLVESVWGAGYRLLAVGTEVKRTVYADGRRRVTAERNAQ